MYVCRNGCHWHGRKSDAVKCCNGYKRAFDNTRAFGHKHYWIENGEIVDKTYKPQTMDEWRADEMAEQEAAAPVVAEAEDEEYEPYWYSQNAY